jgi:hypothetical protein
MFVRTMENQQFEGGEITLNWKNLSSQETKEEVKARLAETFKLLELSTNALMAIVREIQKLQ